MSLFSRAPLHAEPPLRSAEPGPFSGSQRSSADASIIPYAAEDRDIIRGMACVLCEDLAKLRDHPRFVHDFESSVLLVGEHQLHRGYCVLVLKEHVRDLHELSGQNQERLFRELMAATSAIVRAYQPAKMNHASYGNQVPHVHWHIFPRYADDPDRLQMPWVHQARFSAYPTTRELAKEAAELIRVELANASAGL